MPRNPSTKQFSYSAGVPVQPDALLDSGDYNAALQDIVADFNSALPVEKGGTGALSAETALSNLGAASTFYLSELLTGMIGFFAMSSPPDGWIVARGQELNRISFAKLFGRVGTTFGAGNGSTTFNAPDLRGYFVRGLDQGRGVDPSRVLGSSQDDENKEHVHTATAASAGAHTHVSARDALVTGPSPPVMLVVANGPGLTQGLGAATTGSAGSHTHDVTIDSTGSEFRPRNVALLGCIKT